MAQEIKNEVKFQRGKVYFFDLLIFLFTTLILNMVFISPQQVFATEDNATKDKVIEYKTMTQVKSFYDLDINVINTDLNAYKNYINSKKNNGITPYILTNEQIEEINKKRIYDLKEHMRSHSYKFSYQKDENYVFGSDSFKVLNIKKSLNNKYTCYLFMYTGVSIQNYVHIYYSAHHLIEYDHKGNVIKERKIYYNRDEMNRQDCLEGITTVFDDSACLLNYKFYHNSNHTPRYLIWDAKGDTYCAKSCPSLHTNNSNILHQFATYNSSIYQELHYPYGNRYYNKCLSDFCNNNSFYAKDFFMDLDSELPTMNANQLCNLISDWQKYYNKYVIYMGGDS